MAEIRAVVTVPVTAQFAGLGAPSLCAPLVFETTAGDLYVLLSPDTVVKVGGVPGSSDFVLAQEVFSRHIVPPADDTADSSRHLATRIFDRPAQQPQAVLGDASALIAARVFGSRAYEQPVTASEVLQSRSLRIAQLPAMW